MAFKPITLNTPAEEPAHILAEDDAAIYESIIGGDCVLPIGGLMKATVLTNNKVRITDGAVVVGGHVGRIVKGDYEDMTIANGQTGQNRNDIIAARFLAGADGGSDSYSLVVIQGTPGSAASDPVIVRGDLYAGDKQRDYPLWRVCLEGLSVTKVEQMHEISTTNEALSDELEDLSSRLNIGFYSNTKTVSIKNDLNTRIYSRSLGAGIYLVTGWVASGVRSDEAQLSVTIRKNQEDTPYISRGTMKDGGGACITKIIQFSEPGMIDLYTYQNRGEATDITCSMDIIKLC